MKNWYLVFSKPRQENRAQENLDRQGYRTYLPKMLNRRRRRGQWTQVIEPMFPRYLFINLDDLADNWLPIRSTFGVTCMVRFRDTIPIVPDALVEGLLARQTEHGYHLGRVAEPKVGERVRILDGAMAGLEGILAAHSGHERVQLLLNMLGREVQVEIDRHWIEPCT
jgi:transcriptional antiterminator RfaH